MARPINQTMTHAEIANEMGFLRAYVLGILKNIPIVTRIKPTDSWDRFFGFNIYTSSQAKTRSRYLDIGNIRWYKQEVDSIFVYKDNGWKSAPIKVISLSDPDFAEILEESIKENRKLAIEQYEKLYGVPWYI